MKSHPDCPPGVAKRDVERAMLLHSSHIIERTKSISSLHPPFPSVYLYLPRVDHILLCSPLSFREGLHRSLRVSPFNVSSNWIYLIDIYCRKKCIR